MTERWAGIDSKKLTGSGSRSSAAPDSLRGQGGLDFGAVIVRVPDGDLGEAPDPAVPGGQVVRGQARDQGTDGRSAAP
jgi:hypothetical protein